jgi:hypothetical protein
MKQSEIVAAVVGGQASINWVPLGPNLEVMAWPVRIAGEFVAVSARTANACAIALSRDGWLVSLTTPKVEDLIFESAALRPEPVLFNPQKVNIASEAVVQQHSAKLLAKLAAVSEDALVVAGKSWVLTNQLLKKPGRAANYGLYSASAPHRSATGSFRLWQPLSFAHDLDHWDYSQLLRLVRRRPGVALPSYDEPLRVFDLGGAPAISEPTAALLPAQEVEQPGPSGVAVGSLGERCLAWCLEEWETHRQPSAERIAWYHAVAKRNGKLLGIKVGNHCASAQSRAMIECLLPGEAAPHEPRAGAIELQQDAIANGRWHSRAEVQAGKWLPRPGDLAIYNRANPADPKSTWWRHVDRVIRVVDEGAGYENIGANEVAGAWNREVTSFDSHKLLGFIAYPGSPPTAAELAAANVPLDDDAAG